MEQGHHNRWFQGTTAIFLGMLVGACGPIEYVNQVTFKANASVAAAKSADADKYAPYYYTLAIEYLHKAREEAANADYQASNRFGRKAHEAAQEAKRLALENAADPKYQSPEEISGVPAGDGASPRDGAGRDNAGGAGVAPLAPADGGDSDGDGDGGDSDGGGDGEDSDGGDGDADDDGDAP